MEDRPEGMLFWGAVFNLHRKTCFNRSPWSPEYATEVAELGSAAAVMISTPDNHKCVAPILNIPALHIVPRV